MIYHVMDGWCLLCDMLCLCDMGLVRYYTIPNPNDGTTYPSPAVVPLQRLDGLVDCGNSSRQILIAMA